MLNKTKRHIIKYSFNVVINSKKYEYSYVDGATFFLPITNDDKNKIFDHVSIILNKYTVLSN